MRLLITTHEFENCRCTRVCGVVEMVGVIVPQGSTIVELSIMRCLANPTYTCHLALLEGRIFRITEYCVQHWCEP